MNWIEGILLDDQMLAEAMRMVKKKKAESRDLT